MKDYASRNFAYSGSAEPSRAVPVPWGFIVAALVAMLVIYSISKHVQQKSLLQPVAAPAAVLTPAVSKAQPTMTVTPAPASSPSSSSAATSPAKTVSAAPVKFDFYQMLTENPGKTAKVTANGSDATTTRAAAVNPNSQPAAQPSAPATPAEKNTRYYLEVGSYKTKSDALQQKANLILSEVSPKLIKVSGSNGRYRVLIGPYNNLSSATAERSDLRQNGINVSLIKSSDLKK